MTDDTVGSASSPPTKPDTTIPIGGPTGKKRQVLAIAAWIGFGALWAWFLFRMYRGAVLTETGDFNDFFFAAQALTEGADPYASGRGGYLYPPFVAWVLQPLVGLGLVAGGIVWGLINTGLTVLCLWLSIRVVSRVLVGPRDSLTVAAVWLVASALTLGPIQSELEHGQTDGIVLVGLCLAMLVIDRAPGLAGLALGFALIVKHQALAVLAYLLVRMRFVSAGAMLACTGVLAFVPAVQLGASRTVEYLQSSYGYLFRLVGGGESIEGVNLHPITWELSLGVPSVLARLTDGPDGPSMGVVAIGTMVGAAAVFGATWLIYAKHGIPMWKGRGGRRERFYPPVALIEWCGVIIGLLAFSPQAITRHTYILIPAHVLAAYVLLVKRPGAIKWPLLATVVAYQLAARLPPGEEAFRPALEAWRHIGGATWFLLAMWLALVWSTFSFAKQGPGLASQDA